MYIAGAQILENYPIGPLAGVAFNLTLLSYNGSLDMGVNIDAAAVEEPELLRACMEDAFAELLRVGESRPVDGALGSDASADLDPGRSRGVGVSGRRAAGR